VKVAVVGARGQIGRLLVPELIARSDDVVAVGRQWDGRPFGPNVEYRSADANEPGALAKALAGCSTVFCTLGLPYVTKVWEAKWVPMVRSVLEAVRQAESRLVYLDNVYAYGLVEGWMTETTPYRPESRVGRVRAKAAQLLADAIEQQGARIIIARSADFVGPGGDLSIAGSRLFKGVVGTTKAQRRVEWIGDPATRHCYNGTKSNAKALAVLGALDDVDFGQTWHMPTHGPITGVEFCAALGNVSDCTVVPRPVSPGMLRFYGIFNSSARASVEMVYQFTHDYLFSDEKFRARFPDFEVEPFADLLAATVKYFAAKGR
jgi:nucleoside-diphosphate-sugar epimerase